MNILQEKIWILDSDSGSVALYHQTLGLRYTIRHFKNVAELNEAHASEASESRLLIADPDGTKGSLVDFFRHNSEPNQRLPDVLIVSKQDDLELMRFFLRNGARDYILKPLRPNELVAKVERTLHQMSNHMMLILLNDLDGLEVHDLTFREHQILTVLLSRASRSASREEIHEAVWNRVAVHRKTLDVHLFNLRRKLRPLGYDVVCQGQILTLTKQVGATTLA